MTNPDEAPPATRREPVHGQLSYLQIPAVEVTASAEFYARIFGWTVEPPDSGFTAPGLIGQWITDRPPAGPAGMVVWIRVDDIVASLELVAESGGEVLEPPSDDGPSRRLATIADPAGNVVGIFDQRPGAVD
jgi:predicted enzyme related to lactoylglutathione lyase